MNKYLYRIVFLQTTGQRSLYQIVASTRENAEAEACRIAGLPAGTEPESSQRADPAPVDAVVN
jgi:hypothetical protein